MCTPKQSASRPAGSVKSILDTRNLSLHQVSLQTQTLYGRSSAYYLPHNLYYELGLRGFTPSIQQVFALSRISNYRLNDWLLVFGFDVADILHLQILLPAKRTILLDPSLDDPYSWIPTLKLKTSEIPTPGVAPLSTLFDSAPAQRLFSLTDESNKCLYAKIGLEDAFGFPELLPGSMVRVNPRCTKDELPRVGQSSQRLFLIEHAKGLCCCRIHMAAKDRIMLLKTQLSYAEVELLVPGEARILGVADLEIRPLLRPRKAEVPTDLARHWRPTAIPETRATLSGLLRRARSRIGLSFRAASTMSREIAEALGDERYFTASGSLSDYEASDVGPRHIHKVITLCVVYGLPLGPFLRSVGISSEESGRDPIPDEFIPRLHPDWTGRASAGQGEGTGFVDLLGRGEAVPFFLRRSLSTLSGLSTLSLNDFFWIGGEREVRHPCVKDGLFAIVNRRTKKPVHFGSRSLWQQPLYVIQKREGTYICACCSSENGMLVVHPYSHRYRRAEQFRNRVDAEVVGQIVTIVRRL